MEIAMKRSFVSLMVTILLSGCASSFTPTPTLPPTAETQSLLPEPSDHTQLIPVRAGETFELVVPSNPSTGYHWEIIPELDETLVQFVSQDYIQEQPVKPGSGGVDVWTFRGINPGDTTVVLGYYPPANTNDPEEVVTFSIRVE
jgi:inhibitor of cysteine peptidase